MAMKIDRDASRFKEIVRGKIRENLKKYVTNGEMIGRKNGDLVSIPLPQLDVPHFRFGENGRGGVGQGEGENGKQLGKGGDQEGEGTGRAGGDPGEHVLEVELTIAELTQMLAEQLQLPRIEPKGQANLQREKAKYNAVRRVGPESLRHFKRSYIEALRREISGGTYTGGIPVVPQREDRRYRSWTDIPQPEANAVVIYMMDVSGSMTDDQKEIVRTESFWIDSWIKTQYKSVARRYIIHDAAAKEVDELTFYRTRESGGTRISSAYRVCGDLIQREFDPANWNIYCFQFSDGDNWGEDNNRALPMLRDEILPACNLFGYGQVESPYGSGEFMKVLETAFGKKHETLILSEIKDREAIFESIRSFLGKGK